MSNTKDLSIQKSPFLNFSNVFKNHLLVLSILVGFMIVVMVFSQVIITQQKYTIIALNNKISQTYSEREVLEMDRSELLSKKRLRNLALNKIKMITIENIEDSLFLEFQE